jgi:preprotein translocase subunit SecD|tara:strand:+ start:19 stop:1431 length:1413 start_codon:yes stop_codon:yes gene_type:complete
MRKTLLIITAVMLVIGCSKPINDETLIDVDGLKYHPETKELYSGDVFKNYLGGKTEFEGSYKAGKADGKWTYWDKEGRKVSEGIYRDGLWTESFSLTQFLLEVDIPTLVENLAVPVKPQADSLLAAIISDEKKGGSQETFISRFVQSSTFNGLKLWRHFEGFGTTNADIEDGLYAASDEVINQVLEVLENRLYEFGISEPTIQKQGNHRIIVELAGVTDADRVGALLERTALLEFVYLKDGPSTQNIITKIDAIQSDGDTALAELDTVEADTGSSLLKLADESFEAIGINNFTSLLIPTPSGDMGVPLSNRPRVNNILEQEDVKQIIQKDYGRFVWSSDPLTYVEGWEDVYTLYYLDANPNNPRLTGQAVEDAVADIYNGQPIVRLSMNSEGVKTWSVITSRVGDRVAIVLDNKVHMAPSIRSKITDGRTQVEGLDDMEEAKDIAIVLRAGKLSAPIRIVSIRDVEKYSK